MTRFPLLRTALATTQARLRAGWSRVRGAVGPNTQAALAATAAYLICRHLLGQPAPIFAAIACYLCLGFSRNRRPRRVLEIGLGASFGVLIGEVVARWWGFDWWQLLLILLLAPLWARLVDGSDLMTFQSAINAMIVASFSTLVSATAQQPISFVRWIDALVGAAVALVVTVALPSSIITRPRRQTSAALATLSDAMAAIGRGLSEGDADEITAAAGHLAVARGQLTSARTSQTSSADIAALNPAMRAERHELAELDRLVEVSGRLHISLSMLMRQARSLVVRSGASERAGALVTEGADSLRHLSSAIGHWNKPVLARQEAVALGRGLAPLEIVAADDWRATTLVGVLRSVVVDLLQLTGLSVAQARATLVEGPRSEAEAGDVTRVDGSSLWGTTSFPAVTDEGR